MTGDPIDPAWMEGLPAVDADFIKACAAMLGRMAVREMRVGFTPPEDGQPIVWYCVAFFTSHDRWEAEAGMEPELAMYRLLELVMDGGKCAHCERPSGVIRDRQAAEMIDGGAFVCWYAYDPELKTFRRECEGRVE